MAQPVNSAGHMLGRRDCGRGTRARDEREDGGKANVCVIGKGNERAGREEGGLSRDTSSR